MTLKNDEKNRPTEGWLSQKILDDKYGTSILLGVVLTSFEAEL